MRVKIGDTIYDGKDYPIMLILTDADKRNITMMPPDDMRYCQFPRGKFSHKEIEEWMKADLQECECSKILQ